MTQRKPQLPHVTAQYSPEKSDAFEHGSILPNRPRREQSQSQMGSTVPPATAPPLLLHLVHRASLTTPRSKINSRH